MVAYIVSNKYAKTCCNRRVLVEVIVEDVVKCFSETAYIYIVYNLSLLIWYRGRSNSKRGKGATEGIT